MQLGATKTLLIDNYDSFTYNIFQLLSAVNGAPPVVVRNDAMPWHEVEQMAFDNIVLSPGPGTPERAADFGICRDALLSAKVPLLGICLGHQGLAHAFGGQVRLAPEPVHGRTSPIFHAGDELFAGVPQGALFVRYHSRIVAEPLPDDLRPIAWTSGDLVMGIRHRTRPLFGVQFHPESLESAHGETLFRNFRDITRRLHALGGITSRALSELHVESRRLDICPDSESVFASLYGREQVSFWLDSSTGDGERSRFSFMGGEGGPLSSCVSYDVELGELTITQEGTKTVRSERLEDYLEREIARRRCASDGLPFDFNGGFVGYFGYELGAAWAGGAGHASAAPDAHLLFADRLVVFDHKERAVFLVALVKVGERAAADAWLTATEAHLRALPPEPPEDAPAGAPLTFRLSRTREEYLADVERAKQHIVEGETYEVCLTNRIHTESVDPLRLYRTLRRVNPAPYAAFLRFGDVSVQSSSPERFLVIDRDGNVESKPIKGTRARKPCAADDSAVAAELRASEKDRSENLMIVDLLRNDLGAVCEVGTVHVPNLMDIETYETVHQLVSTIRGKLRSDASAVTCLRTAFPGGSMTGAPKIRTMRIIGELEVEPRGVYSGAIGFLALNGTADMSIVIRSIVQARDGAMVGVGGAVVALSDAAAEFDETMVKARVLVHALLAARRGEADAVLTDDVMRQLFERGVATIENGPHAVPVREERPFERR